MPKTLPDYWNVHPYGKHVNLSIRRRERNDPMHFVDSVVDLSHNKLEDPEVVSIFQQLPNLVEHLYTFSLMKSQILLSFIGRTESHA